MGLTEELITHLMNQGAALVRIGSLEGVEHVDYPIGISVAVTLPPSLTKQLQSAPNQEYIEQYRLLNEKLNRIVLAGEAFLADRGYRAYAQTTNRVIVNEERISSLPHKTVATRSGLGWIGKNNLLVTKEYGSAIRLSSLLTDAPLELFEPINESQCGNCTLCVQACPAQALHNKLWKVGMFRDEIVDVEKCYQKQLEIMQRETGRKMDLCGKCFAVCAYTQKYLRSISET